MKALASQVAHDINNPLAYIVSNLRFCRDLLEQNTLSPQERHDLIEALTDVQSGVEQILTITHNLKSLASE
jgi:signal transduction histidine kinase